MSTCGLFVEFLSLYSLGKLCKDCGPNTMSTDGALFIIFSPS